MKRNVRESFVLLVLATFVFYLLGLENGVEVSRAEEAVLPKLNLAAVKFQSSGGVESSVLVSKIQTVLNERGDIDLIITPEYTFYQSYETTPVEINCGSAAKCVVYSTGLGRSQNLADAIAQIQDIARTNGVNIVLGTVAEIEYASAHSELTEDIIYNSQLIISRDGRIVGKKRKTVEWYSSPNCSYYYHETKLCSQKAYELALDTVQAFTLINNGGQEFTILPTICGERDNADMLDIAGEYNVDVIADSEREGDVFYEEITRSIQDGTFDPTKYGWDWAIEGLYIREYIERRNIVKEAGYLLVSEGGSGTGGIINFQRYKLRELAITNDYVYGKAGSFYRESCNTSDDCGVGLACKVFGDYPSVGSICCREEECAITDGCFGEGAIIFDGTPDEKVCKNGEWLAPSEVVDLSGDERVDSQDVEILVSDWGEIVESEANFNRDGKVNGFDFVIMISYWTG